MTKIGSYYAPLPKETLTKAEIMAVLDKLPPEDRLVIDQLAAGLIEDIQNIRKERGGKYPAQFAELSAYELICKVGMYLVKNDPDGDLL